MIQRVTRTYADSHRRPAPLKLPDRTAIDDLEDEVIVDRKRTEWILRVTPNERIALLAM